MMTNKTTETTRDQKDHKFTFDMVKKSVLLILFILNFLFLRSSFGQNQLNIPDYITQRFQNYCKLVPWEEIFIQTDRDQYISGEDLWFNTYLIDRQSFRPSSNSKIVYFEILNPENRPIVQKRLLLVNGFGPGQVILPDTLSSGTYTIRAYTNWMKNFLPDNCFLKYIDIFNPFRKKVFRRIAQSVKSAVTLNDSLPARSELSLEVNNFKKDSLEIFVHTNEKFRTENNNKLYLFIQAHGKIDHFSTERVDAEITRIAVPKNTLFQGINQITIFDSKGPVIDRLVYTTFKENQKMILRSADSCKRRSKVVLEIESTVNSSGISDLANLSISVAIGIKDQEIRDMNEYLVLGTEFGLFPNSTIHGRKINEIPLKAIDSLLLTLKSNWINWESIFSPDDLYFKYPREKEAHYISGRLLTDKLQPAKADEMIIMSTVGREAGFQYTTTDKKGNFNFRTKIEEIPEDLIIQPDYKIKNQKVYIESSFSDQYIQNKIFVDSIGKLVPPLILRESINYQIRNIYGSSSVGNRLAPLVHTVQLKRFYGSPDFELNMKDFLALDSIPEVFFELVPHVKLEFINSEYEMSVTDQAGKKLEGVPTVMIDGIIIKNPAVIARLDPGLVEKIDVVWDRYRVGDYIFNGIVNIISKTADLTTEILPSDAVRLHSIAIDTVCSFVSPDYSLAEMEINRIADYRNTLYWNPSVKLDKDGKARIEFWTSDNKSDYIINIQGITSEGNTISLRKIIRVK
jgi:hypothetical protein